MRKTVILILMMAAAASAYAQHGLHVNALFEGRIIPQERMVETKVRGKMIAKYQLSYFRSLRFRATAEETRRVLELVEKDKQENYRSTTGKHAKTIMTQLPPQGGQNRFLCCKVLYAGKSPQLTVIYMEGTIASLDKMREILKD